MTSQRGSTPINAIQRGSTPYIQVQRGSTILWQLGGVNEDFEVPDGPLSADWTNLGPSSDWKLGIEDGRCRVLIPDSAIGFPWDFRSSVMRYNASVAAGDNGFVECRAATRGDGSSLTSMSGYTTQVWGRANNTGSDVINGAGIHMKAGHVWIAKRTGDSTGTVIRDCGTFQSGDILRLNYTGSTAAMFRNGEPVGTATLTGVVANASNRSLAIRGDGAKDALGPRRFSPALDYVRMG